MKNEELIKEARLLIADCKTYNFGMRAADRLAHEVAGKLADALEGVSEVRDLVSRPGDAPHVLATIAGYNLALKAVRAAIESAIDARVPVQGENE